jgi:hypothetical protein
MTANAINAKGEALELHELSSEELDAVSGGSVSVVGTVAGGPGRRVDQSQDAEAVKSFAAALQH